MLCALLILQKKSQYAKSGQERVFHTSSVFTYSPLPHPHDALTTEAEILLLTPWCVVTIQTSTTVINGHHGHLAFSSRGLAVSRKHKVTPPTWLCLVSLGTAGGGERGGIKIVGTVIYFIRSYSSALSGNLLRIQSTYLYLCSVFSVSKGQESNFKTGLLVALEMMFAWALLSSLVRCCLFP